MALVAPVVRTIDGLMTQKPPAGPAFGHRNLPLLLLMARESVIRQFRPVLQANGLTEQQWRVLRVLAERGATEPRELVRLCGISSPSLTGMLARMDDLGLVARKPVAGDQRRVLVSTTARSRAIAARIAPQVDAIYAHMEARLGERFVQQMYKTLDRLVAELGEPAGEGESAPPSYD